MGLVKILKGGLLIALFCAFLNAEIFDGAQILSGEVRAKLNQIGIELKSKTGVDLDLITTLERDFSRVLELYKQKNGYIALILSPKGNEEAGKIDIFATDDVMKLFDKDAVLSPYPEVGTIIPILVSNKGEDIYNAALLNGYADIADQVAQNSGVILENSIGNSNRTTLNLLRYLIYGSILLVIVVFAWRKFKRKL